MPALWKSILHKDKPGYSSNAKSQFEMMNSVEMNSRSAARTRNKMTFDDKDSDENDLISGTNAHFTTTVHAGDDIEGISAKSDNRNKSSLDDARILRTVEVRQFHETPTHSAGN